MTPAELIKILSQYPQGEEIDFLFNPCKNSIDGYDIETSIEVMGDPETSATILMKPKLKSKNGFETLEELLSEKPAKISIDIEKSGVYVFVDGGLRREIEFITPVENIENKSENIIKKLIEIL